MLFCGTYMALASIFYCDEKNKITRHGHTLLYNVYTNENLPDKISELSGFFFFSICIDVVFMTLLACKHQNNNFYSDYSVQGNNLATRNI